MSLLWDIGMSHECMSEQVILLDTHINTFVPACGYNTHVKKKKKKKKTVTKKNLRTVTPFT